MSHSNKLLIVAILQFAVIVFLLLRPVESGTARAKLLQAAMPAKSARSATPGGELISASEAEQLDDEIREKEMRIPS